MRSQTFDLLTPQPFGRDPTFSPFYDVFSDDFFFRAIHGHVRNEKPDV